MISKSKLYNILMVAFLIISLLYTIETSKVFQYIGYGSILLATIMALMTIGKNRIMINSTLKIGLIFIIYNITLLILNYSATANYSIIQEIALILFVLTIIQTKKSKDEIDKISEKISLIYYIGLIIFLSVNLIGKEKIFATIVSMTIYKAFFAMSFFAYMKSKNKLLFIAISSIIFFIIGERTSALILICIYFANMVIKSIKSKKIYRCIFIICTIILVMFPRIYVWIQYQPIGKSLNNYSRKLSGENFFSGRNLLWEVAYDSLEENEVFGLGYNNNVLKMQNINLSTHNLYIWLQLNGGYVLLTLFIVFLYTIWMELYSKEKNENSIAAAYLLGFMMLLDFELLLLCNNFVVSIYMWFVIGIGVINARRIKKENDVE